MKKAVKKEKEKKKRGSKMYSLTSFRIRRMEEMK